jgi:hypothetical protein
VDITEEEEESGGAATEEVEINLEDLMVEDHTGEHDDL